MGEVLAFWGVLPLYVVSGVLYGLVFLGDRRSLGPYATGVLVAAVLVHIAGILILDLRRDLPLPLSSGESLSLLALATAICYVYVELRTGERGLGMLALVLVVFHQGGASAFGPARELPQFPIGQLFGLHVAAYVLAFASFSIGAFSSISYLLQYRQLRSRRPGLILERLPSLEVLDTMALRANQAGMLFLTVGLILGAVLAHRTWGVAWSWDPKQCTTLLTWLLYGFALFVHRYRAWQGGRLAAVTLAGFATIILSLFVLSAVVDTAHRFA